jgi:cobalt/nickel transport system permease protein
LSGGHAHDLPAEVAASGFLERRDARAKILVAVALVLAVVLAPEPWRVGPLAGLAAIFATLGATPPWRVLARATVVLPFALLGTVFLPFMEPNGLAHAGDIIIRALVSGLCVAALGSSTDLADLVRGLGSLGVPRAVIVTMSFTLRYLQLLRAEGERLMLAREMRTFSWRPRVALRAMGHSVGTLFVRTFERAERVHAAMAARGFTGSFPSVTQPRFGPADFLLLAVFAAAALLIDVLNVR